MKNRNDGRQLLTLTFTWVFPDNKQDLKLSIKIIDGKLFITGRIQYADKLNGNERYYPRRILLKAIKKFQPMIDKRLAYCEMDHPDSDIISVERITALITKIFWNGDLVLGTLQILSNRRGEDIRRVIVDDKGSISISSRGLGSLKRTDKGDLVQDDYLITTWDLVIDPSTPNATFWSLIAIHLSNTIDKKIEKLILKKPLMVENNYIKEINEIFKKYKL